MTPTAHLRWGRRSVDYLAPGGIVLLRSESVLEQFVEIGSFEGDITLPRETGPDGRLGRWVPVPEAT